MSISLKMNFAQWVSNLFHPPFDGEVQHEYPLINDRTFVYVLVILVLYLLPSYYVAATRTRMNADEWQAISTAFMVNGGGALYGDVWDNHGPFMTDLIVGYFKVFDPRDNGFVMVLRLLMFAMQLGTMLVTYLLAVWVFGGRRSMALLALFLALATPIFQLKGSEIRGDNPMNLVWMASLLVWIITLHSGKRWHYLLSGLILGGCFLMSVKTLVLGVAVGGMFLAESIRRRRLLFLEMVWFGLGSAIVPIVMIIRMKAGGNLDGFIETFFGQNFDRPRPAFYEGYLDLREAGANWLHAMIVAYVYTLVQTIRGKAPRGIVAIMPCGLFLLLQYLFLIPTHHHQSFLVAVGPSAIVMAWALLDLTRIIPFARISSEPNALRTGIVVGLFVIYLIYLAGFFDTPRSKHLRDEILETDKVIAMLPEDASILDGYGRYYFRTNPTIYPAFVETVRDRIRTGTLDLDIPRILDEKDVYYFSADRRTTKTADPVNDFMAAHYVPFDSTRILAAGRIFAEGTPQPARLDIAIAGEYYWGNDSRDMQLYMDGQAASNPIRLEDGKHEITWTGTGPVMLCVHPPKDWTSVAENLAWLPEALTP